MSAPRASVILVALLGWGSSASAGGWTQPQGGYYQKVWTRILVGSVAYTADGLREGQGGFPRYQDYQLNFYGEVGLVDRLTLVVATTPLGFASMNGESALYVGPTYAGLRAGLLQGDWNLALEAHYGFAPGVGDDPLYDEQVDRGDGTLRRVIYAPAVQNHRGELQLQVGTGLRRGGWITASLGARLSSNAAIDHALTAYWQYGHPFERWTIEVHAALYEPFGADVEVTNISGVGQTRYLGFGLSTTIWMVPTVGLYLGFDGVVYATSNAATPALYLGVEVRPPPR